MKTNRKIIFCVALVLCLAIFAGCNLNLSQITSIQLLKTPQTTFVRTDDANAEEQYLNEFSIQVNYNDKVETYTYEQAKAAGLVIENFSLKNVGIFQATINFQGFKVYFDYQVIDGNESGFAGGTGESEEKAYLISTSAHWNNIDAALKENAGHCYFKLTNDIDFKDIEINQIGNRIGVDKTFRKIILDGNGYSLRNIDKINLCDGQSCKYLGIMNTADGSIIKNINIYYASESANRANAFVYYLDGNLTFENVNTYGYINTNGPTQTSSNVSPFVATTYDGVVKFHSCNNYTNILGGAATYAAGFAGTLYSAEFIDCNNYGNIEGAYTINAGFIGENGNCKFNFSRCNNYGTITEIGKAYAYTEGDYVNNDKNKKELVKIELDTTNSQIKFESENNKKLKDATFVMLISYGFEGGSAYRATDELDKVQGIDIISYRKYTDLYIVKSKTEFDKIENIKEIDSHMYRGTIAANETILYVDAENNINLCDHKLYCNLRIYAYDENGIIIGCTESMKITNIGYLPE